MTRLSPLACVVIALTLSLGLWGCIAAAVLVVLGGGR